MNYEYGQKVNVTASLSVYDPAKLESMDSIMRNAFRFGWKTVEVSPDGMTKTVTGVTDWYPGLSSDASARLCDAPDGFASGGLRILSVFERDLSS